MKCQTCEKYLECVTGSGLTWPCGAYVSMQHPSNGDRIRAMSDEDLASMLITVRKEWNDYSIPTGEVFTAFEDAVKATVRWLRSPAKVEPQMADVNEVLEVVANVLHESDPDDAQQIGILRAYRAIRLRYLDNQNPGK